LLCFLTLVFKKYLPYAIHTYIHLYSPNSTYATRILLVARGSNASNAKTGKVFVRKSPECAPKNTANVKWTRIAAMACLVWVVRIRSNAKPSRKTKMEPYVCPKGTPAVLEWTAVLVPRASTIKETMETAKVVLAVWFCHNAGTKPGVHAKLACPSAVPVLNVSSSRVVKCVHRFRSVRPNGKVANRWVAAMKRIVL